MLIAIDHGNKQMKTVNCPESLDVAASRAVDRAAIEEIVAEILGRTGAMKGIGDKEGIEENRTVERGTVKPEQKRDGEQPQNEMDQATMSLIADTMSAFRGS